ncbi:MAG: type II secretion system major pseudopilin GspG [Proteobacteria bacterium]|nr:type II secretion system major pseudopilin GspG [Pseudomonadota bacterium]
MRNARELRRSAPRPEGEAGYTLTEMLVVIGIIGLIAAVLTPGLIGHMARAKAKTAQLQLDTVAAGVEMFEADVHRYPTAEEGLAALVKEPPGADGWTGPYLRDRKMMNDPWGRPLTYTVDAASHTFTVKSLGADGKPGGSGVDRDLQAPAAAQ